MKRSIFYAAALVWVVSCHHAMAQSHKLTVVQRLPGYVCVEVSIPGDGPGKFATLPSVYAAPAAGAAKVGVAQETMIADAPVKDVGGYVRVMLVNKHPGWLSSSLVKQWHSLSMPGSRCYPAMMSNGLLGFDYARNGG